MNRPPLPNRFLLTPDTSVSPKRRLRRRAFSLLGLLTLAAVSLAALTLFGGGASPVSAQQVGGDVGQGANLQASVLCADTPNQSLSAGVETTGQWGPGCDSETVGFKTYARYYSFTVPERKSVTVTLKDKDRPLSYYAFVLRRGTQVGKTDDQSGNVIRWGTVLGGAFKYESATQVSLTMDLAQGTYDVEALGPWASEFSIGYTLANPSAASDCHGRSIGLSEEVKHRWFSDCPSSAVAGKQAAHYDLSVSGTGTKRINIRLESYETQPELYLWRASDFTGSGANRTLNAGATWLRADTFNAEGNWNKRQLHVNLQGGGDYVIEAVAHSTPSHEGTFKLGVTTGVEPPDYVPENCGEIPIYVMYEFLGQPVGALLLETPLPVGGSNILFQSTKAIRSADLIDLPFGNHADDELYRLGNNDKDRCTGDRRDGWPVYHFVFRLDADVDLTVAISRTSGAANDADKHGNVYDLANLNNPSHTLRKIGGERPREATDIDGPSDTVPYFYIDIDQAPAEDCFTAGETPPCETASGTYNGLTPGTYALTVTMDPPANKPNRVTQPGPFSVGLATAASQGFGLNGLSGRTGFTLASSAPVFNTTPAFTAEAADQTARLYEAFSYTAPQATVAAGATVSYSAWLSDLGKLPDWLSFNAATRTFSGTPEIDDFPATLDIVVIATDEDASPQTATTEFTLTVARPTWNMPPRFHEGDERTTRTLAENSPAGTKVGKPVTAFDPNGDALSYLYLDGGDAAYFSLDPDTGQLTTIEGVTYDYETKSTYDDLLVIVEETDTEEAQHTGINVTVNLTDVQEEESTSDDADGDTDESTDESETEPETPANTAPSFDANLETTLSVDENSAAGTNVGSAITASDPDEGDTLTYSLTGTDAASFTIGSSSGQIATKTGVTYNFEAKSSYSLTVNVSDGNEGAATFDVTVSLNDVAEAPTVSDTSAFKTHNAVAGDAFTLTLPAADANSGDGGPYSYLLWHKGAGKNLATEAVNGLSFDATTRTLSGTPEAAGTWELNYVVHDGDANRNAATDAFRERDKLKIVVTAAAPSNQADDGESGDGDSGGEPQESQTEPETPANTAPSFDAGLNTTPSVDENSPAGTNVGSAITASDPDTGDTLTYSLTGTDAASFTIGSSSGQIATKTGVTYNYEAKSSYSLTVNVSDGNGGAATVDVTVSLNDVNEAPAFAAATAARSLPENSAAGTDVGSAVTATDPDTGDTLTYSLSGTDAASFTIDSATGQISTATGASFDFETKTSYALIVSAADPDGLSDSVSVTVSVTDVAEPSPPTASAGDDFNAKRGEVMTLNGTGTAHASGSQTLTYQWTISDASDAELVTVGNKGFLTNATQAQATFTVMKKRNMTNKSVLNDGNWIEFTLTVKDGDGESHSDKVKLTIQGTTWKATVQ